MYEIKETNTGRYIGYKDGRIIRKNMTKSIADAWLAENQPTNQTTSQTAPITDSLSSDEKSLINKVIGYVENNSMGVLYNRYGATQLTRDFEKLTGLKVKQKTAADGYSAIISLDTPSGYSGTSSQYLADRYPSTFGNIDTSTDVGMTGVEEVTIPGLRPGQPDRTVYEQTGEPTAPIRPGGSTTTVTPPAPVTTQTQEGTAGDPAVEGYDVGGTVRPETIGQLAASQEGFAGDIRDTAKTAAESNYEATVAAIDAAELELLGGYDKATGRLETQAGEYDQYIDFGQNALTALADEEDDLFRSFTLDDFIKTPAYELRRDEGEQALLNKASALGVTGQTAKDLLKYNQDYAYDAFTGERNYFTDTQNRRINYLTGAANMGLGALSDQTNIATNLSNLDIGRGNIKSGAITDRGTAKTRRNDLTAAADIDFSRAKSNIAGDYFGRKTKSEFDRRLYDQNTLTSTLQTGLGSAALGYKLAGGPANPMSPWVALGAGVLGGATNYFARS
jgi:hypothetical protein